MSGIEFTPYSEKYDEWTKLSDDEIIDRFNRVQGAPNPRIVSKVLVQDRYLAELSRRESVERESKMVSLTNDMHKMTRDIRILTVANVILVLISLAATLL